MTDLLPDGELVDAMAMAERLVAADPERGPRSLLARALIQTHLDVMAEHEARVRAERPLVEAAEHFITAGDTTALPCGHRFADLVSAPGTVTKCGACVAERAR